MTTRQESMEIAARLTPNGFKFNSLTLEEGSIKEPIWVATYIDESDPPRVVVERWDDFYTENDPAPETDDEDETDTPEPVAVEDEGDNA